MSSWYWDDSNHTWDDSGTMWGASISSGEMPEVGDIQVGSPTTKNIRLGIPTLKHD